MSRGAFFLENLQQRAEIRAEKFLEIVRSAFRHQHSVGLQPAPMGQRYAESAWHSTKTFLQVNFLHRQGSLQDTFEDLLVAHLKGLLYRFVRIHSRQPSVLVSSAR